MAQHKFTRISAYPKIAGRRIKVARESLKLRQEDVAKAIGVVTATVGNYEQGTREMTAEIAVKLSGILREHPAYLIGLADEIDREILNLPVESRMHIASAFKPR